MQYEKNFADLPPFPDKVPTAPLLRLDLQKLIHEDADESRRLWDACTKLGFFYLDIRPKQGYTNGTSHTNGHTQANGDTNHASKSQGTDIDGNQFLEDADRLFEVSKKVFALPLEEKIQYDLKDKGSYFGYKGYGGGVVDAAGTKDRNEFYNVR